MSDLEKYYTLALWEYKRVKYDNDFWSGHYNFEYYSHQWDAYGALKEKSVCAGMAVFYANLCHAADLPCKFVRLREGKVDHTINYIPDINGNAYYVDVTEDCFLMSNKSCSFAVPEKEGELTPVDTDFAHITKDCTDYTFDYPDDSRITSATITDCLGGTYEDWFNENALHEGTDKNFMGVYDEKGSGTAGKHYASYHDYESQCFSGFNPKPGLWFLEDFYEDPAAVSAKILNKEFDEQLLNISGVKGSYESETSAELVDDVSNDIIVRYFPSCDGNEVVPWEDNLKTSKDYEVTFDSYDEEKGEAVLTLKATGKYKGTSEFRVKWTPKKLIENARILPGIYSEDTTGELEPEVVYLGAPLEEGTDYTLEKVNPEDRFDQPGDYEVKLTGKGNFKGTDTKTFYIVLEEGAAEQAVKDAKEALAAARKAIAALDENATTADITNALRELMNAEQIKDEAEAALARTKDIMSENQRLELEEQVAILEQQLADQSEEMQGQIEYLNGQLEEALIIDISCYPYTGSIKTTFKITKKSNTLAVKGKTATVKYKTLKKKAQSLGVAKVITVTNKGQGTVTYAKVSGNKKITINKKTGKVTVKKGLKKGNYKIKAKVKAAGKGYYNASAWKNVTITIRVK